MSVEDWDVDFAFPDFNLALFERERGPCLKFLTQITLEDENEQAEIREVFPKKLTSESFDDDNKLTLKKLLCLCIFFCLQGPTEER